MRMNQQDQGNSANNQQISWPWQLKLAMLSPFIAFIALLAHHNLQKTDLWYDESGQFWMALGLNHYSPPFSLPGGLTEIIANNINYNMDPGGFTLILRGWIEVFGTTLESIRSLPLFFFLLTCAALWRICRELKLHPFVVCLSPYLLLLDFLNRHYAFEVRAYSAESFAWLIILLFTIKLQSQKSSAKIKATAIVAGIISSLCLGLRYSIIVPVASQAIIFFGFLTNRLIRNSESIDSVSNTAETSRQPFKRESWIGFGCYLLIVAGTCLGIYAITLSHQISGGDPPGYVQELLLSHGEPSKIFLQFGQIKTWLPVIVLFAIAALQTRLPKARTLPASHWQACFNSGVHTYCLFVGACIAILLFLSFKGKYPLAWDSRWDIGIHTLCLVAPLILLNVTGALLHSRRLPLAFLSSGLFIAIALKGFQQANKITWVSLDNSYEVITECITPIKSDSQTIAVDQSSAATVRYLYEHGPLKDRQQDYRSIHWMSPSLSDDKTGTNHPDQPTGQAKRLEQHEYVLIEKNNASRFEPGLKRSHERCPASAATVLLQKKDL